MTRHVRTAGLPPAPVSRNHAVCSILRFAGSLIARSAVNTIWAAVAAARSPLHPSPQCVGVAADMVQNIAHYVRQILHSCQNGPLMRSTLNHSVFAVARIARVCLLQLLLPRNPPAQSKPVSAAEG